jgi:hypothetical protein
MAVKGVFASDQNIPGARKGDFAAALLQTMPTGSAPLLALSSGMQTADAMDTVVTWFEENHISGRISVTNNAGTGTAFNVNDSSGIIPGQVMMNEASGEYLYVDAVPSATSLTVTRGFAGSGVVAIDGSVTAVPIQRLGTAFEEGSSKPTAVANLGFPRFNYMQLFRNAWDVTGTARAVEYHTGNLVAKNKADAGIFHSEDMERSMLWGKKVIGTQNGKPFRTMDGIITQITDSQGSTAQGTNTTWTEIDTFLQTVFEKNIKGKPNERIAFCGNKVISVLNQIARIDSVTNLNLEPRTTEFGMKITSWLTPYGDISLLTHPLMNESPFRTEELYVLHPGAMRTRWLRRTHEDNNDRDGSRAGVDADFGVITSEMCIEYKAASTGGVFTGINTAA